MAFSQWGFRVLALSVGVSGSVPVSMSLCLSLSLNSLDGSFPKSGDPNIDPTTLDSLITIGTTPPLTLTPRVHRLLGNPTISCFVSSGGFLALLVDLGSTV